MNQLPESDFDFHEQYFHAHEIYKQYIDTQDTEVAVIESSVENLKYDLFQMSFIQIEFRQIDYIPHCVYSFLSF